MSAASGAKSLARRCSTTCVPSGLISGSSTRPSIAVPGVSVTSRVVPAARSRTYTSVVSTPAGKADDVGRIGGERYVSAIGRQRRVRTAARQRLTAVIDGEQLGAAENGEAGDAWWGPTHHRLECDVADGDIATDGKEGAVVGDVDRVRIPRSGDELGLDDRPAGVDACDPTPGKRQGDVGDVAPVGGDRQRTDRVPGRDQAGKVGRCGDQNQRCAGRADVPRVDVPVRRDHDGDDEHN